VPQVADSEQRRSRQAARRAMLDKPRRCGACAACQQPWLRKVGVCDAGVVDSLRS